MYGQTAYGQQEGPAGRTRRGLIRNREMLQSVCSGGEWSETMLQPEKLPLEQPTPEHSSPPEQAAAPTLDALLETVRRTWGFGSLRPLQEEAVCCALEGRDALVVLPTGGGKSLCYQAPALVREGLTVVVSPLISLMVDQVRSLEAHGVSAGMLASTQEADERRSVERALWERRLDLLYVAPERMMAPGFLSWVEKHGLSSIAVDEAHCISHWGHDFRPEYRQLGELKRMRPDLPVQAFTATATPEIRVDIAAQLGLCDPSFLVGTFDRPELTYRVRPRGELTRQVMEVVERHSGRAGIVYCLRRADTESLARKLAAKGVRCLPYHAGLSGTERRRTQAAFDNEELDVICATVAFGMGIDRSDVRFIVHASLPKGIEAYVQETGRAGRDGLPAECLLLYSGADFHGWKHLVERSALESENAVVDPDALDHSLARLDAVWRFATGAVCRHRYLARFFGQEDEWCAAHPDGRCNACDVCLGEIEVAEGSQVLAQKILSCVVRCAQRFGAGHVVDVLRGSDSQRLRQYGHDRLSTYGLMKEHGARELRSFIDQLVGMGCLGVAPGRYPTLHLTQDGVAAMKGELEVTLHIPPITKGTKARKRKQAAPPELDGLTPDPELFDHLRKTRRELARERGVPPYVIFNDRTLAEMAARKPATPEAFLELKGVGEKKAADLGPIFLAALGAWDGEPGSTQAAGT